MIKWTANDLFELTSAVDKCARDLFARACYLCRASLRNNESHRSTGPDRVIRAARTMACSNRRGVDRHLYRAENLTDCRSRARGYRISWCMMSMKAGARFERVLCGNVSRRRLKFGISAAAWWAMTRKVHCKNRFVNLPLWKSEIFGLCVIVYLCLHNI